MNIEDYSKVEKKRQKKEKRFRKLLAVFVLGAIIAWSITLVLATWFIQTEYQYHDCNQQQNGYPVSK